MTGVRLIMRSVRLFFFFTITVSLGSSAAAQNHNGTVKKNPHHSSSPIKHVVLLGIDGFHALDLENYVASHPSSALAELKRMSLTYTDAHTARPSDSFPGILSMVTGGTPF